jgi:hypothetical protein
MKDAWSFWSIKITTLLSRNLMLGVIIEIEKKTIKKGTNKTKDDAYIINQI